MAGEPVRFAASAIVGAKRMIVADRWFFVIAIFAASIPGLISIWSLEPAQARYMAAFTALLTLYLQLLATFRALARSGAGPDNYVDGDATEGRFISAFAASFLSTVGIIVGVLLLIVPGLILFARWSLWMPALAAERAGPSAALSRSWALSTGRSAGLLVLGGFWLAGTLVLATIAFIPAMIDVDFVSFSESGFELAMSTALMISPAIWTAAWLSIRGDAAPPERA